MKGSVRRDRGCRAALSLVSLLTGAAKLGAAQVQTAPHPASQPAAQQALTRALAEDLAGDQKAAFADYLRAADAGLPQAQLNAAVMLDSGEGTAPDRARAALYYALAASSGERRAAYDLALLYASGEGVPRNPAMAESWFSRAAALGLDAAASHLRTVEKPPQPEPGASPPHAPDLIYPAEGAALPNPGHTSFVWNAPPQPTPTVYFVEIASLTPGAHINVEPNTVLSALSYPLGNGAYAWRVFAVSPDSARYATTPWYHFRLVPPA